MHNPKIAWISHGQDVVKPLRTKKRYQQFDHILTTTYPHNFLTGYTHSTYPTLSNIR
ncbi:MAG: hypothetical protein KZQ68_10335 [gamma proteobacterium symbiont of Bathyaustriella thionipta]|nr:hypothetical protein [gamma proteobacterium symbiont of Bathyaustriella thionipta]